MRRNSGIRWLYDQLPALVAQGVLDAAGADALRRHYGPAGDTRLSALTVFGILGATLIGAGVVLLLAHNWDALAKPVRLALAFAPLLIGQALALYTLLRRSGSVAWRESSATLVLFGIGAAIGLVGQIYQLDGDLAGFLLTWVLLALPLVYLLRASLPALLILACLPWQGMEAQDIHGHALWLLPPLAALLPHIVRAYRDDAASLRAQALLWALAICLTACLGIVLEHAFRDIAPVAYLALFSGFLTADRLVSPPGTPRSRRPLHVIGYLGLVVTALWLSTEDTWRAASWEPRTGYWRIALAPWIDGTMTLALLGANAALLWRARTRLSASGWALGLGGPLAAVLYGLAASGLPAVAPMAIFNLYLLAVGVLLIRRGLRGGDLTTVNGGLLAISLLIALRFFDSDLPFTVRGIAFIVIGAGFLGANLFAKRKGLPA